MHAERGGDPRQRVAGPDAVADRAVLVTGGPGRASTVPGRMTFGSGPMACRLAAYRAGQPPATPAATAMPDSVSPG
jgi:hypothetical protein